MKKLNITKEAFEKSQYFNNKYGKLKYVSESGRLFKTDKGKILKFKESRKLANESSDEAASPDNVQVDDILYCTSYYDFMISTFYKVLEKRGMSTLVLQRLKKNYTGSQTDGVAEPTDTIDSNFKPITVRYGKHGFKIGGNKLYVWDGTPLEEYNYSESKKFGKKFKESANDDIYGFYEWLETNTQYDSGIHVHYYDNEDGSETVELRFDDRYQWDDEVEAGDKSKEDDSGVQDWMRLIERKSIKNNWEIDTDEYDGEFIISVRSPNAEDDEDEFMESDKKFDESMNWRGVTSKQSPTDPDKTIFTRTCPMCGKLNSIEVDTHEIEDGMSEYGRGARIQDAFPNLTPDEREFFMSGVCNDCWENM